MERRIFGIENEYGVTFTHLGQRKLTPDEVSRHLFRRVVSWGRSSNVFLENGSRLYLDVGSHPEYATPECASILDVVTHDKAGEWVLSQLVQGAEERLHEENNRGEVFLFKNNVDSVGNSYGCHENYLMLRNDEFAQTIDRLIPFLVSRQIFAGAGKIVTTPRGPIYGISQRADYIWEGVSSATTRSRPIINTRDEPHADVEKFRRLHVIVGDSNMSEYATFLKVGAMAILLRLLEDPVVVLRDLTLDNSIRAIREISADLTLAQKVRLANGRDLSALEIQREYFDRALRYHEIRGLPEQEAKALEMWGYCLDQLERDPMNLVREVDWVAKLSLIEGVQARHGVNLSDPRCQMVDLMYHDINRERGLYYRLQNRGHSERMTNDREIAKAMTTAPADTRAALRGRFVQAAKAKRRDYTVDWVHLKLNDQAQQSVALKDPFACEDERVDVLIASL
ncbi:MAG: Pup--protein ligase [Actinomycetes bacterium]